MMRGRGSKKARGSYWIAGNREWKPEPQHSRPEDSGPLMTSHLRDIDIELEILNRKREMIKQEHDLLNREREYNLKRQYEYEQPSMPYSQPNLSGFDSNHYRQQGGKRQAVEKSPPKRFKAVPRVDPWQQNISAGPRSRNLNFAPKPQPLLEVAPKVWPIGAMPPVFKTFRPTKPEPAVRKDFNPTKVTKPKSRTAYLQKPTPPSTVTPSSKQVKADTNVQQDYILRSDVTPSPQLNGRLELALGSILKDIKHAIQGDRDKIITPTSYFIQRTLKHIIRERIRSVMMNKFVGPIAEVVQCYRQKYPLETDADLIKLGKQAQTYQIQTLGDNACINSERAVEYFKINVTQMLHKKLDKMFDHIKKNYNTDEDDVEIIKHMDNVVDLTETTENNEKAANEGQNGEIKQQNDSNHVVGENDEMNETIKKIAKAKAYSDLMEDLIDKKLPKILPKYKDIFVSMINTDKEYQRTKLQYFEESLKIAINVAEEKKEEKNSQDTPIINEDRTSDVIVIQDGDTSNQTDQDKEKVVESVLEATPPAAEPAKEVVQTPVKTPVSTPNSKIIEYPYYVKLIGNPELPSRSAVYEYLEQFKPASIKKHKTIGNLLVLGFNDKEGYDKILECGDKTIGTNTMIIKGSEKQTPQKSSLNKDKNAEKTMEIIDREDNTITHNDSFSICPELDDQITSLLSDIKNTEENNSDETTTDDIETNNDLNPSTSESNAKPKEIESDANKTIEIDVNTKDNVTDDIQNIVCAASDANTDINVENINKTNTDNIIEKPAEKIDEISTNNIGEKPTENANKESTDKLEELKSNLKTSGRATPTRSSSRLANVTPSTIKTRRASRLAQNN